MNPFIFTLLLLNLGASGWFVWHGNWPWALIYFSASGIQAGCLWITQ